MLITYPQRQRINFQQNIVKTIYHLKYECTNKYIFNPKRRVWRPLKIRLHGVNLLYYVTIVVVLVSEQKF